MNLAEQTIVGRLEPEERKAVVSCVRGILRAAPLYRPCLPGMTVRITNAGKVGWHWTEQGPRYLDRHPVTGRPWPPIPDLLLDIWGRCAKGTPDCAHVVWYEPGAKLGPHQDKTEADKTGDVLTISEGAATTWSVGRSKTELEHTTIEGGDITLLSSSWRMLYHGIGTVSAQGSMFSMSYLDAPGRLAVSLRAGASG